MGRGRPTGKSLRAMVRGQCRRRETNKHSGALVWARTPARYSSSLAWVPLEEQGHAFAARLAHAVMATAHHLHAQLSKRQPRHAWSVCARVEAARVWSEARQHRGGSPVRGREPCACVNGKLPAAGGPSASAGPPAGAGLPALALAARRGSGYALPSLTAHLPSLLDKGGARKRARRE